MTTPARQHLRAARATDPGELADEARRPPLDALHPAVDVREGRRRPDHRPRRGRLHLRRPGQALPRRPRRAVRRPGRARPRGAGRGGREQAQEARVLPALVLRAPEGDRAGRALLAHYAPGDLNRVFFTTGGGEAVETAWKLAKQYFKLIGKPIKHKVISRAVAYHGTPQGALSITGIPDAKKSFEPLVPGASQGAEHQLLPRARARRRPRGVRSLGRRPDREAIEFEGRRHRRRRVPRAGAELRRLLPAAARLLRSGCARSATVRRAAGLRRDHLRASAGSARCSRARRYGYQPDIITCAKGMTSGYSPIGAMIVSDRIVRAVQARQPTTSRTATPSAGTRCRPPWRWPTSTSSSARASISTCSTTRRLPRHAREAARPADRRRRARRRLLLRHRAGQGQGDPKETFDDDEAERLSARLPVEGALRRRPVLPRRRPRRPGGAARAAADHRPARVRRDRADPARRADRGVVDPLSRTDRTRVRRLPEKAVSDRACPQRDPRRGSGRARRARR